MTAWLSVVLAFILLLFSLLIYQLLILLPGAWRELVLNKTNLTILIQHAWRAKGWLTFVGGHV